MAALFAASGEGQVRVIAPQAPRRTTARVATPTSSTRLTGPATRQGAPSHGVSAHDARGVNVLVIAVEVSRSTCGRTSTPTEVVAPAYGRGHGVRTLVSGGGLISNHGGCSALRRRITATILGKSAAVTPRSSVG